MKKFIWVGLTVILLLAIGVYWLIRPNQKQVAQARLIAPDSEITGFARAEGPKPFVFPQDFGPHPEYQTEWWYYTGNLDTEDGHHFGYQLTFFRRSLVPPNQILSRKSDWATDQAYMAHLALTDVQGQKFQSFERLERGSAGIAGATIKPNFHVWLRDWSIEQTSPENYTLKAIQGDIGLDLSLDDIKGPILEGDQGYSRKGPEPGNASYYISQTRLLTKGKLTISGQALSVSGTSWMDHEFSTSALSQGQTGWDWFALQLSDQTEVMVYQIRREDGNKDPYSNGTFVDRDNHPQSLPSDAFRIQASGEWKSLKTGADYPSGWKLEIPSQNLTLEIQPYLQDQENRLTFVYWEGAVKLNGVHNGKTVSGVGYVELTGYSGSLAGQF